MRVLTSLLPPLQVPQPLSPMAVQMEAPHTARPISPSASVSICSPKWVGAASFLAASTYALGARADDQVAHGDLLRDSSLILSGLCAGLAVAVLGGLSVIRSLRATYERSIAELNAQKKALEASIALGLPAVLPTTSSAVDSSGGSQTVSVAIRGIQRTFNIGSLTTSDSFLIVRSPVIVVGKDGDLAVVEGITISDYRLSHKLAEQGAIGQVWEAERYETLLNGERRLIDHVIIKMVPNTPEYRNRFDLEWYCQAVGSASDYIVRAISHGITATDQQYIVMEKAHGGDLENSLPVLRQRGIADIEAILLDVISGVAYVHNLGVIHRDIKAANCLLEDPLMPYGDLPRAKASDFGFAARAYQSSEDHYRHIGTLLYMAPEILHPDRQVTVQSDVFALGVLAYYALTGCYPFNIKETDKDKKYGAMYQEIKRVLKVGLWFPDAVPLSLRHVIMKALSWKPEDRYQNATELLEAMALHRAEALRRVSADTIKQWAEVVDAYAKAGEALKRRRMCRPELSHDISKVAQDVMAAANRIADVEVSKRMGIIQELFRQN